MKFGITIGRFMPLTKGHEFMLHTAWINCDHLAVMLGDSVKDCFNYKTRYRWVHNYLNSLPKIEGKTWEIIRDADYDRPVSIDGFGTITDDAFWDFWMTQNSRCLSRADLVFTSDRYGATVAEQINRRWPKDNLAKWFPVDPDRELYQISASMFRAAPMRYYSLVSDWAKPNVGMTVAVVGAESTGKSTMTKKLAKLFDTTYAPEWGRIVSEAHPDLTMDDFNHIVMMQRSMIRNAQVSGRFLNFTDTEAIITSLFAPIYLGEPCEFAELVARQQTTIDHYLVLAPTVPLVQDGTRVLDDAARLKFHDDLITWLHKLEKPFTVISNPDYLGRFAESVKVVERLAYEKAATFLIPWRQKYEQDD